MLYPFSCPHAESKIQILQSLNYFIFMNLRVIKSFLDEIYFIELAPEVNPNKLFFLC